MARRKTRARENPLSDTTTLFLYGLGAVAIAGVGYLAYRKWQERSLSAGNQQFAPQLPQADATRGQPPPGANAGSSSQSTQQQQQQQQVFRLGDVSGSSTSANTSNEPPPRAAIQASTVYVAPQPPPNGVHAPRTIRSSGAFTPKFDFEP